MTNRIYSGIEGVTVPKLGDFYLERYLNYLANSPFSLKLFMSHKIGFDNLYLFPRN